MRVVGILSPLDQPDVHSFTPDDMRPGVWVWISPNGCVAEGTRAEVDTVISRLSSACTETGRMPVGPEIPIPHRGAWPDPAG
jgi:hypothetical protein